MNQSSSSNHNQPPSFSNPTSFGGMARPPGGHRQAPQTSQAPQLSSQAYQQLVRLLPHIEDSERRSTREQILEILAKDMKNESIQALIASKQGQGASNDGAGMGGVDADNGLNQEPPTVLDITVHLECQVNVKYSAVLSNANYKGLSKRMIQSLKSNKDQRTQLLNTQELSQIEEFINQFTFERPRAGGAPQVQESAGSAASAPTQASNPFAFSRPSQGPPGGQKRPAGPQSRMPQQRFAVANMFVPPAMEYQPGAINPIDSNQRDTGSSNLVSDGAAGSTKIHLNSDHTAISNLSDNRQNPSHGQMIDNNQANEELIQSISNHSEQERPSVQFIQNDNQNYEEEKTTANYVQSDSGAADFINAAQASSTHQAFNDFEFFNKLASEAVKNQTKQSSPQHLQNSLSRHSSNNQSQSNSHIHNNQSLNEQEERLPNQYRQDKQSSRSLTQHDLQEEQANQNQRIVEEQQLRESQVSQDCQNQFQQFVQDFPLQEEQSLGSEQAHRMSLENARLVQSTLITEEEEQQQTQVQQPARTLEEPEVLHLVPHFESFSITDNEVTQGQNQNDQIRHGMRHTNFVDPSLSSDIQLEEYNHQQRYEHPSPNQASNAYQFIQTDFEHKINNILETTNQTRHEDERLSFPNFPEQQLHEETSNHGLNHQVQNQFNDERDETLFNPNNRGGDQQKQDFKLLNQSQHEVLQGLQNQNQIEEIKLQKERVEQPEAQSSTHLEVQAQSYQKFQEEPIQNNQMLQIEQSKVTARQNQQQDRGFIQNKGQTCIDQQMKEIEDINKELQASKQSQSVIHHHNHTETGYDDSLSKFDIDDYQSKQKDFSTSRNQSISNFATEQKPPKPQNVNHQIAGHEKRGIKNPSPIRESQFHPSQSVQNFNQMRSNTPTMQGLMQYSTSKPPQSVASINITNLEDSEALIRAYKKKKNELDELREVFYRIETEFFTEKQKAVLFEEENAHLKQSLAKAEKQIRDMQMKESGKDSLYLQKQLQLKSQEAQAYQNELANQKQENLKLRDRLKEQMARHRHSNSNSSLSSSHPPFPQQPQQVPQSSQPDIQSQLTIQRLNENISRLNQEKNDLLTQVRQLQTLNENVIYQSEEQLSKEKIENQIIRDELRSLLNEYNTLQNNFQSSQAQLQDQKRDIIEKESLIQDLNHKLHSIEEKLTQQTQKVNSLQDTLLKERETQENVNLQAQIVQEQKILKQEDKPQKKQQHKLENFAQDVMSFFDEDKDENNFTLGYQVPTRQLVEQQKDQINLVAQSHKQAPANHIQKEIQEIAHSKQQNHQLNAPLIQNEEVAHYSQRLTVQKQQVAQQPSLQPLQMAQFENRQESLDNDGLFGLPAVKAQTSSKYNFFDEDDEPVITQQVQPKNQISQAHLYSVSTSQSQSKELKQVNAFYQQPEMKQIQPQMQAVKQNNGPPVSANYPVFQFEDGANKESAESFFSQLGAQSQPLNQVQRNQSSHQAPQNQNRQPPPQVSMIQPQSTHSMMRPQGIQHQQRPIGMNQQVRPPISGQMAQSNHSTLSSQRGGYPSTQLQMQQQQVQQPNQRQPDNVQNQLSINQKNKYVLDDEDEGSQGQTIQTTTNNNYQTKQINQVHSSLFD